MNFLRPLCLATLLAGTAAQGAVFVCDPARGTPQGDGSAERPWRTAQEVIAAKLIQARDAKSSVANPAAPIKPGDTIQLRSGWHGLLRLTGGHNPEFITFAAAPGQTPSVGAIEVRTGSKWRFKGLTVSPSLAPAPLEKPPRNLVQLGENGDDSCAELIVEDCFIYSVLDASAWSAKDWVAKPASGIWLGRHGKGHVARNNFVLNTRFGINLCAPEVVCEGNVVANFSGDGIRVTRDGQVVRHNVVKNNFVGARDGDDNHDDGIQAFPFNRNPNPVRDVVIAGNIVISRERDGLPFPNPLQGVGFFDGPLVNFKVEGNVILVNHYHGITLSDAQGSLIRSNACFSRWAEEKPKPWIMIMAKKKVASGNTVENNLAHSFSFKADAEVKTANNLPVEEVAFRKKLADLAAQIDEKYGRVHPLAQRPRLDLPWLKTAPADTAK